ncbi:hypothetical protein [Mycobacterium sp.]|uniref:FDXHR family putative zinc-binding protein n=1 Tax=Mycobacterium sp. TaxID=1785 RepID=UPI003BEF07C9
MPSPAASCDNWWTGLNSAHCAGQCHETFTPVSAFDADRRNGTVPQAPRRRPGGGQPGCGSAGVSPAPGTALTMPTSTATSSHNEGPPSDACR